MAVVVLLDDDPLVRETLRLALTEAGHKAVPAATGREALALIGQAPPDLLITDILMPDQDGLEVIQEVRRRVPGLPILAVSVGLRVEDRELPLLEMALMLGATSALQKPFDAAALLGAVEDCLHR